MRVLSGRFDEALRFASEVHRQQTRKGTTVPYMTHLMAVSAIVGENGGDEDQMIAALLHDAMEDQGVTRQEIEQRFGKRVADIVEGCTDTIEHPKPPWRQRKEQYLEHLLDADSDTKLVSAADKLHNARSILGDLRTTGPEVWARFNATADEILWYHHSLIKAFRKNWHHPLLDELERVVHELVQLQTARAKFSPTV